MCTLRTPRTSVEPGSKILDGQFQVGEWLVEPQLNSLTRAGETIRLEPKVMQVLVCLAEHAGEVLPKERLIQTVWSDTFVSDDVLTRSISELRRVFGDDSKDPHFIQTIPKSGYRLIAPVSFNGVNEEADSVARRSTKSLSEQARAWWRDNRIVWLAVGLILIVGSAVWFYFSTHPTGTYSHAESEVVMTPMKTVPFTSSPGLETYAAFSPDGKQITFSWEVEMGDRHDIYVKLVGAGEPLRLTSNPGDDIYPTWSPDGRYIAFVRQAGGNGGIFMVPALGGSERRLQPWYPQIDWWITSLSWSPDGKLIAFPAADSPQESPGLFLLSVDTLEKRRLTSTPEQYLGDGYPVFSPDGQTLAFIRQGSEWAMDIYLIPVSGGEPKRLTFDNRSMGGLDWTPDGREIVFSSNRRGSFSLWKIPVAGGSPEPLTVGGDHAGFPSISRVGNRLAYTHAIFDTNIWKYEPNWVGNSASPTEVISSTRADSGPQISPDGKRIAFQSDRSGSFEIWLCQADGSNPIQLTAFGGPLTGAPRWSPDGRQIAFDSRAGGHYADIYVINAEGGSPRRITTDACHHEVPTWSRDGRWIYFSSNQSGGQDWQLWKIPAEGGQALQVTNHGGVAASESSDGKFIYFAKFSDPGIWRMPVEGGAESLVTDQLDPEFGGYWALVDQGIYFVTLDAKHNPTLKFFNFATSRVTQVGAPEKLPYGLGLAVSPDGRWLLYTQVDQGISDIMMVENFR